MDRFLRAAKRQALLSQDSNFRVGAVVVRGRNIIGFGFNQGYKSHPLQAQMHPERSWKGPHAEVDALKDLRPYDVGGGDIYVYRVLKDGRPALARPCEQCMGFLQSKGIRRAYYTLDSGGVDFIPIPK